METRSVADGGGLNRNGLEHEGRERDEAAKAGEDPVGQREAPGHQRQVARGPPDVGQRRVAPCPLKEPSTRHERPHLVIVVEADDAVEKEEGGGDDE